jgi:hypothetical protein
VVVPALDQQILLADGERRIGSLIVFTVHEARIQKPERTCTRAVRSIENLL